MRTTNQAFRISLMAPFVFALATLPLQTVSAESADSTLLHVPATHVPHDVQEKLQEGAITHVPPQMPAATKTPAVSPDTRPAPRTPVMPVAPTIPREPTVPGHRTPDHQFADPARDAAAPAIHQDSVHQRFEGAVKLHPAELEGLQDAEGLRDIPGIEGTGVDPYATPGQGGGGFIPGQQGDLDEGPTFESQGFQRPDGMPASPLPDRTGQGPRRLVGPPSADLRGSASGIAGFEEGHADLSGGRTAETRQTGPNMWVVIIRDKNDQTVEVQEHFVAENGTIDSTHYITDGDRVTRVYTTQITQEGEYILFPSRPADGADRPLMLRSTSAAFERSWVPLDRLQDGDADVTGGSGVNPITGLPTRPPKEHPDQVNPGPEGAVVMPAGVRLRGTDLEVNPDPERHQRGYDPGETMRRFESPDPGPMPEGTAGADVP